MTHGSIGFASGALALLASAAALGGLVIALIRRPQIPAASACVGLLGMFCLVLAAAGPVLLLPTPGSLAVMVDLSPSTRTASFRDARQALARLHELIGDTPYKLFGFSAETHTLDPAGPWAEMAAEQTLFSPPPADAIVLFSDARFELPLSSPPVFIVADAALENVADAAVNQLQIRGDTLAATLRNSGPSRIATFTGVTDPTTAPVGAGRIVLSRPLAEHADSASVALDGADPWPENDAMTVRRSPPMASQLWWIGPGSPPSPWRSFSPRQVPLDAAEFLAPAAIVLNNVAAPELGQPAMDRLVQYVRDLGGSLLILGGNRAFSAGEYPGTPLEMLSPLSSSPPAPATRWVLLVDSSGSMNGPLWQAASSAVVQLLPRLPPQDPVDVGQFSADVRWWSSGRTAGQTAQLSLPPADAHAGGPTNLEPALTAIAAATPSAIPTQLLLLSDCDVQIDQPQKLTDLLKAAQIHLQVLALGHGSGLEVMTRIAHATGGSVLEQLDPQQWVDSIRQLMQTALPPRWEKSPTTVQFMNEAASLGQLVPPAWNRTWIKQDAQPWAKSPSDSMAAFWHVGSGSVAAVAFAPPGEVGAALARIIAQPPRDPRFSTHWDAGATLRLTVDAADKDGFLNDLALVVEVAQAGAVQAHEIPQIGPGAYELSLPAPRQPAILTLRDRQHLIDRIAVAGRYAPEFDALGNDHETMRRLAERSGGAVIWPSDHQPIDFHWPGRRVSLTSWLSGVGALCIAMALLRARGD
jgi:hypothetical protein